MGSTMAFSTGSPPAPQLYEEGPTDPRGVSPSWPPWEPAIPGLAWPNTASFLILGSALPRNALLSKEPPKAAIPAPPCYERARQTGLPTALPSRSCVCHRTRELSDGGQRRHPPAHQNQCRTNRKHAPHQLAKAPRYSLFSRLSGPFWVSRLGWFCWL